MQLIDYPIDIFSARYGNGRDVSFDLIFKHKENPHRFRGHLGCYLNRDRICKICIYYDEDRNLYSFEMSAWADDQCIEVINNIIATQNIKNYIIKSYDDR